MSLSHFDERDEESWYFGSLSLEESSNLLWNEDTGVFLVRDSSRGEGYVICVKEKEKVNQYPVHIRKEANETHFYVREEGRFRDMPTLLSFYKQNMFESTALIRPISRESVDIAIPTRGKQNTEMRHGIVSDILGIAPKHSSHSRASAPPDVNRLGQSDDGDDPPRYARVIKAREGNAYDQRALTLNLGDVIRITSCEKNKGIGWGELNGKATWFPLTHVKILVPETNEAE